jgi:kinetochore protein Mis12/MTW1
LLDDIINSINILAERALNSTEQGLLRAPPSSLGFRPQLAAEPQPSRTRSRHAQHDAPSEQPEAQPQISQEEVARHEIENGTHQLETLLCASIDRNFDKFELYVMRNILCVRPEDRDWIRLDHYEGLNFAGLPEAKTSPDRPTTESVTRLRRRLQASQKLNCMLHAEKARNEALLVELRALVGVAGTKAGVRTKQDPDHPPPPFGFLHDKGSLTEGDAETPLTTTTAFTLSQLQALRALSTSLRNILPDLGDMSVGDEPNLAEPDGKKSWRRERLEYVEAATRKHLENVRGLELGKNGEVRDGEWQGEGRKVGKGEVGELEKVVAILRGGSASKNDEMDES